MLFVCLTVPPCQYRPITNSSVIFTVRILAWGMTPGELRVSGTAIRDSGISVSTTERKVKSQCVENTNRIYDPNIADAMYDPAMALASLLYTWKISLYFAIGITLQIYCYNCTMTFAILHCIWFRSSFLANSRGACGLCLRNFIVYFGCVIKVPDRCYMPWRHEKEKSFFFH